MCLDGFVRKDVFNKNSWVVQGLIISLAINVGLLSSLIYIACKKDSPARCLSHNPEPGVSKPFYVSSSAVEVLSLFFEEDYEKLCQHLTDDSLVEDGYRKRDFALACLISFHYFDIQKALSGTLLQERFLEFVHKDGGERVKLRVFPSLDDEQFEAILFFAKTEKWPLTHEGLFYELQRYRREQKVPSSLKETFYLTSEFNTLWMLFNRSENILSVEQILELMLDADWNLIETFYQNCLVHKDYSQEMQRTFLLSLVEKRSKAAARVLLERDLEFVLEKLDDGRMICLLALIDEQVPNSEQFVKELVCSARSDVVLKMAGLKLYTLYHLPPPSDFQLDKVLDAFHITHRKTNSQNNILEEEQSKNLRLEEGTYVVQGGDSLWKISKKFNVKLSDLKELNQIKATPLIKPGMKLKIPSKQT